MFRIVYGEYERGFGSRQFEVEFSKLDVVTEVWLKEIEEWDKEVSERKTAPDYYIKPLNIQSKNSENIWINMN